VIPINAEDFDEGYYTDSPGESDSEDEMDSGDGLDSKNRWESGDDWDFEDESLVWKSWEPKPSLAIPIEEGKRIDYSLWSDSLLVRELMTLLDASLEQGLEKAFDSWQVTADQPFLPLPPFNNSIPLGDRTRPIKRYRGQKQDLKNLGVVSTTASSPTNENAISNQGLSSVIETRLSPFTDFTVRPLRVYKIYNAVLPITQLKKRRGSEAFLSEDSLELPTADIPYCDWHKEMQSGEALSRQTPGPELHITYRPKKRRKIGFDTFPQEVRDMVW